MVTEFCLEIELVTLEGTLKKLRNIESNYKPFPDKPPTLNDSTMEYYLTYMKQKTMYQLERYNLVMQIYPAIDKFTLAHLIKKKVEYRKICFYCKDFDELHNDKDRRKHAYYEKHSPIHIIGFPGGGTTSLFRYFKEKYLQSGRDVIYHNGIDYSSPDAKYEEPGIYYLITRRDLDKQRATNKQRGRDYWNADWKKRIKFWRDRGVNILYLEDMIKFKGFPCLNKFDKNTDNLVEKKQMEDTISRDIGNPHDEKYI